MNIVTNSMIFNDEGQFNVERLSAQKFCENVKNAWIEKKLKSYLGYVDTMQFIQRKTGVKLNINSQKLHLRHGDTLLVIKKRYLDRKDYNPNRELGHENDYEFFKVHYLRTA